MLPLHPIKALRKDSHFAGGEMDAGCAAFSLVCETSYSFVIIKKRMVCAPMDLRSADRFSQGYWFSQLCASE